MVEQFTDHNTLNKQTISSKTSRDIYIYIWPSVPYTVLGTEYLNILTPGRCTVTFYQVVNSTYGYTYMRFFYSSNVKGGYFSQNTTFSLELVIISAHKSDLSYPWSQTQASLSIPSLHPKNTNKRREREEKNNRRENLPRSDRRGREKIKQEQKNKSKDPPRISERQIDKQARQTKCQDHTDCRYRTRVAKHTPPVAGRGAADSQALRQGAPL